MKEGQVHVVVGHLLNRDYRRSDDRRIVCRASQHGLVWCHVLIACVTALGGGSVRDVLLGHYPLTWVKHPEYLVLTCIAAFITILIAKWMRHLRSIFLVLDALGLIGFTIIGCQIALKWEHGLWCVPLQVSNRCVRWDSA